MKIKVAVILLALFWIHQIIPAELNMPRGPAHSKESSIRRAEIIFFISLPFVLIGHFGATGALYSASTGDTSFNRFPPELTAFNLLSSLFVSGLIAIDGSKPVNSDSLPYTSGAGYSPKDSVLYFRFPFSF